MNKRLWHARRYFLEIKIGTFFLVGALIFFIAVVSIRESAFLKSKYPIKVKFNYVEGLRASSPVRFCGVDVGEVDKVEVIEQTSGRPLVYVYAKISKETKIPRDSWFFINSLSLFGEKYLEITPQPDAVKEYYKPHDEAIGMSPTPIFATFNTFDRTMQELERFIKEGELKSALEGTFINLQSLTEQLNGLLLDVRSAKGTVGKLFYDEALYEDLDEFVKDIKAHPWKLLHKTKKR